MLAGVLQECAFVGRFPPDSEILRGFVLLRALQNQVLHAQVTLSCAGEVAVFLFLLSS